MHCHRPFTEKGSAHDSCTWGQLGGTAIGETLQLAQSSMWTLPGFLALLWRMPRAAP